MIEFFGKLFGVPTIEEAQAISDAGSFLNLEGIILWPWIKGIFLIYISIGALMFMWWIYTGIRDAYRDSYGLNKIEHAKYNFQDHLERNFENFWKVLLAHLFAWPIGVISFFENGGFRVSKFLPFVVDKYDRWKSPEKYI